MKQFVKKCVAIPLYILFIVVLVLVTFLCNPQVIPGGLFKIGRGVFLTCFHWLEGNVFQPIDRYLEESSFHSFSSWYENSVLQRVQDSTCVEWMDDTARGPWWGSE